MLDSRSPTLVFALALLSACPAAPEQAKPEAEPAADAAATTAEAEPALSPSAAATDYSEFGMPEASGTWSLDDYKRARKAFSAIAKADPSALPRADSPTFTSLANLEALSQDTAEVPGESLLALVFALGHVHEVYADQRQRDPSFEREYLVVSAAVLAVASQFPRSIADGQAEALRAEPSRLRGLLKARHTVHQRSAELLGFTPKSELDYGFACEQLAAVIDPVAPLLLPEERSELRAKLDACATGGADPAALERLRTALADEAPSAAVVTALLAEHREFKAAESPTP